VVEEDREGLIHWLSLVPGLGKAKIDNLAKAGYTSIESINKATIEELSSVQGIGTVLARKIKDFAARLDLKEGEEGGRDEKKRDAASSLFLCTNCGALIAEGGRKCSICGAEFEEGEEEEEEGWVREPLKALEEEERMKKPSDVDGFWYKERPGLMICTNCGALIAEHERKCSVCGAEFEEEDEELAPETDEKREEMAKRDVDGFWYKERPGLMICTNCGALITEDLKRCGVCGAEFEEGAEELAPAVEEEKKEVGKEKPSLLLCSNCGAIVSEKAEKCAICGAEIKGEIEKPEFEKPKEPEREKEIGELLPESFLPKEKPERKKKVTKDFLKRWERVKGVEPEDTAREIELCDEILEKNPDDAETLKRKAYLLVKTGRYDEALKTLEKSQVVEPVEEEDYKLEVLNVLRAKEGVPVISLEEEGVDTEKVEEALRYYDRLLEVDPSIEQAWQTKGELLEVLGRRDEALECFDRAIEARSARQTAKKLTALSALKKFGAFEAKPSEFIVKKRLERGPKGLVNATGKMNGLINGFINGRINGLINGKGRINGVVSGLVNGNGLINGEGLYNGRGMLYKPKATKVGEPTGRVVAIAAATLVLILVVPVLSNFLFVAPTVQTINIDGDFSDWNDIRGYDDLSTDQTTNMDVNIMSYKIFQEDSLMSVYAMTHDSALAGTNEIDTIMVFVDRDADAGTGYEIKGIGADLMALVQGWAERIETRSLYAFQDGSDPHNWSGFIQNGNVLAGIDRREIELQFEVGPDYSEPKVLIQAIDGELNTDFSDAVISVYAGALTVTESTIAPEVVNTAMFPFLQLQLMPHGGDVLLESLSVRKDGNLTDDSLELYLFEDTTGNGIYDAGDTLLDSSPISNSRATFDLDYKVPGARTMFAVANVIMPPSARSLGLRVSDVATDAVASISSGYMTNVYVGTPLEVIVDGAFADWSAVSAQTDQDGDLIIPLHPATLNENVDIRDYRINRTQSELSFYLRVDGKMLGGIDSPLIGQRPLPPSNYSDQDGDTVPDQYDTYVFDFNNDDIPDDVMANDVDYDGITDHPYGNDYWLNTTIPPDYPEPYRNRNVTIYIGPIAPRIVRGVDEARIFLDSDDDPSTGLQTYTSTKVMGMDHLVVVTGRNERILSSEVFEYNGTGNVPWQPLGNAASRKDSSRLEVSVPSSILNLSANASALFQIADWNLRTDTGDQPVGTKSLEPTSTRSSGGEGTKSPAGDNVVLNEISPIGSPEWVELCNPTASSIDLSGWTIQRKQGGGWVTVYTFGAGASIGAWGSGTEYLTVDLAANSLPDNGGTVILVDATATEVDRSVYPKMNAGESWARYKDPATGKPVDTDNKKDWYKSSSPSKGAPNDRTQPAIVVQKTGDKTQTSPGETIVYTITYDNTGDGNANTVWINDTLPNYVTYQSSSEPYDSFSGRTYRWVFTDLAPGTYSFTITVRVNDTAPDATVLQNIVDLDFTDQLGRPQTGSTDSHYTICRRPIITIVKVADKDVAGPGERIVYTIYYNNTGTGTAGNVWINDTIPQYVTFRKSKPNPSAIDGRTLRWHFTDVPPGDHSLTIEVDVNATAPTGDITNVACLNYTSAGGVAMGTSCDTAVTNIPEFSDAVIPIFGILVIFLFTRSRKKNLKDEREDG
jgi:uncharacterized repeat protein (TIGR01451 family)